MKKFFKLFGIICILLVIGFSFAACEDGSGGGGGGLANTKWSNGTYILNFTSGSQYTVVYSPVTVERGTYTFNGSSGTLNDSGSHFTVSGNTLTITDGGVISGTYTKQ